MGPHELSIREVARRAGVSHAAPYRHFADKESLLAALAEKGYATLADGMQQSVDAHPDSPLLQYRGAGRAYLELARSRPALFRLMFSGRVTGLEKYESLRQTGERSFQVLVSIIEACQHAQLMREGEPRVLALAAWSMVHGLSNLLIEEQLRLIPISSEGLDAFASELTGMLVEGLRRPAGG